MDTIEIRPNRKYLIPFTFILILGFFFMNYLTFFTDYYKGQHFMWKILSIVLSFSLITAIYKLYKQIKSNSPFIIMTASKFSYHEKENLISHNWRDIAA